MTADISAPRARWPHAVWLIVAPALVNVLTGVWLALSSPRGAAEVGARAATDPQMVALLRAVDAERRIGGVLLAAFCTIGILVAWIHRRGPDARSLAAVSVVPIGFGAVALVMLAVGDGFLAGYYGVLALVAGAGVALLAARDPRPVARSGLLDAS